MNMSVMEHRLIILLLLTGVLPFVLSLSRKYFLIQEKKTWSDAQTFCRDGYTDLAVITTTVEMNNLQTVARTHVFAAFAWIGLYTNINKWYWTFENESVGSFTSWIPGEPNNAYGNETCGFVSWTKWFDAPCKWELHFVCFDDRENATTKYVVIYQYKSWYDAQIYCRQYHTDLASARNATENSVVGTLNGGYWTWIGLKREPWRWTDQTTNVSAIGWWGGSIYDYWYNKSCVFLYGVLANVEQCSNALSFFCYLFPVQQKIIRMKFKSTQDVNDPVIMASIEEKLKQKLEERGMRNITVTWRKQPDGEVFHKEENIAKDITYAGENCNL